MAAPAKDRNRDWETWIRTDQQVRRCTVCCNTRARAMLEAYLTARLAGEARVSLAVAFSRIRIDAGLSVGESGFRRCVCEHHAKVWKQIRERERA